MTESLFDALQQVIAHRRTVKPSLMNGRIIPNEEVEKLFALADWAPTHGRTEPWRFYVYTGEALKKFGHTHAELYWRNTPEAERDQKQYDKQLHNIDMASHLVIVAMKRGSNPKIPALEEICATSAAIQNLLLGATALGIASMWSTSGMTHRPELSAHLGLGEEDMVLALVYLGYTDEPVKEVLRRTPLNEKVHWME